MKLCPMLHSTALLFLIIVPSIHALGPRARREQEILDKLFEPGQYDKRIRPSGGNETDDGPLTVKVNVLFRDIQYLDDINMEWKVQITFRTMWTDERLIFDDFRGRIKYLSLIETDKVWTPDIFFKNEKTGHDHKVMGPNRFLRIFPDGRVLHSVRLSLTLSCDMDLKLYPMDQQVCPLSIASYGFTTDDIALVWQNIDPIQVTRRAQVPRFSLQKFQTDYCNTKTNTGEYSCLKVNMLFNREVSYYFLTIYVPLTMLVVVSWVTFWIERKAVSTRIMLASITLFVMHWGATGINQSLPPVSYTKAIDVWTGWCTTFVFSALIVSVLIHYISQWDLSSSSGETYGKVGSKFTDIARKIDIVSRMAFPILFLLFNIVYWPTYLNADTIDSHYFNENAMRLN